MKLAVIIGIMGVSWIAIHASPTLPSLIKDAISFQQVHPLVQIQTNIERGQLLSNQSSTQLQWGNNGTIRVSPQTESSVSSFWGLSIPLFTEGISHFLGQSTTYKIAQHHHQGTLKQLSIAYQVLELCSQWHRMNLSEEALGSTIRLLDQRIAQIQNWVHIGRVKPSELSALRAQRMAHLASMMELRQSKTKLAGQLSEMVGHPISNMGRWVAPTPNQTELHPQLKLLQAVIDSLKADAELANFTSNPNLTGRVGGEIIQPARPDGMRAVAQLTWNWPWIDGGNREGMTQKITQNIQRAMIEYSIANTQLEMKRRVIENELSQAFQHERLRLQAYESAHHHYQTIRSESLSQLATSIDVIMALSNRLNAHTDWLTAQVETERIRAIRYWLHHPNEFGDP